MTIQDHITGQPGAGQFLLEAAPDREMPELGLTPQQAQRLITEELWVDGIPAGNLATFVTTWMGLGHSRAAKLGEDIA